MDCVRSLWVGKEILPWHQPPHARPTCVASRNLLAVKNVLDRFGVYTVCGDDEVGLQDVTILSSDFAILRILVYA
jgi:hypothetical protein